MPTRVAIVYNEPIPARYGAMHEEKAILGVLDEVEAAYHALEELGYSVARIPLVPPLEQVREQLKRLEADVIFNLFEGFDGEPKTEAIMAEMLFGLGLPCTGCPPATIALAQDKARTKSLLEISGIATPKYQLLSPATLGTFHLSYPCIVKPEGEHASHGLSEESVVYDFAPLEKQLKKISQLFGGQALVEEFIDGREFNTTVMGNREPVMLCISEIVYSLPPDMPRVLTFAAKWEPDSLYFERTQAICPASISDAERECIARIALATFKLLGCRGYARVDMRTDGASQIKVLEVNPNPDISPGMGAARQAESSGYSYNQFIARIVQLALERR
ncbi:MAG: ATP-grasp domain-containing protein [Chloroflexota bacterium]|nr:ATP-grasp domain-containing protein [Chloroflexota bacterium]